MSIIECFWYDKANTEYQVFWIFVEIVLSPTQQKADLATNVSTLILIIGRCCKTYLAVFYNNEKENCIVSSILVQCLRAMPAEQSSVRLHKHLIRITYL